jgi:amino acid permease
MAGAAAIPEMRQILIGQEKNLKKAIVLGTAVPFFLYLIFAFVVIGVTGTQTSQEAIKGLEPYLGGWVIIVGAVFGVLAMFTSFLGLGYALKQLYTLDFKVKKTWAHFLVCSIPLAAFLLGMKNFIILLGIVGSVAAGADGILMILIYLKAKKKGDRQPEYNLGPSKILGYALIGMFLLGMIYQFIYISGK